MQPIKTAVIGYGFSAKTFHIPFIANLSEFELAAISSSQQQIVTEAWPDAHYFATAEELIANSDAELVIITAPNDVHFELAKKSLEQGKHVIIEKPFVTKVSDGEHLIALAEEKGLLLSVYHNRRWDGDFLTVKKMIEEKRFGEVKIYESHFDRFRPEVRQRWREQAIDGGGILFDLAPHLIDQALTLFGLPDALSANCLVMREGSNNIDYFDLDLHYPDLVVKLHSELYTAGPNRRFTIRGTKGSYEKLGLDPQEPRLIAGVKPIDASWAEESPDQHGHFYTAEGSEVVPTECGGYQHYFTQIAQAIRTNAKSPVLAQDALWNIKLIELAMESARQGKRLEVEK